MSTPDAAASATAARLQRTLRHILLFTSCVTVSSLLILVFVVVTEFATSNVLDEPGQPRWWTLRRVGYLGGSLTDLFVAAYCATLVWDTRSSSRGATPLAANPHAGPEPDGPDQRGHGHGNGNGGDGGGSGAGAGRVVPRPAVDTAAAWRRTAAALSWSPRLKR